MSSRPKKSARKRQIKCPKTTPREETASVGPQEPNVHLEIHACSSMTRTKNAKRSDDFVHLLQQV